LLRKRQNVSNFCIFFSEKKSKTGDYTEKRVFLFLLKKKRILPEFHEKFKKLNRQKKIFNKKSI